MIPATHICCDPNEGERKNIVKTYFNVEQDETDISLADLEEFFAYYRSETLDLRSGMGDRWEELWTFPVKSHQQVVNLVRYLRVNTSKVTRNETQIYVRDMLSLPKADNFEKEDTVIDLALRLWLMINFRLPHDQPGLGNGRPCVAWHNENTLEMEISLAFPRSSTELPADRRRLHPNFKAATMLKTCRLKIEWTSSLEDHLRLDREQRTVWVFEKRRLLRLSEHLSKSTAAMGVVSTSPLPADLLEETNSTLDLLFPFWDSQTQALLRKRRRDFHRVKPKDRVLDLRQYHYWRDRLLELYEDIYLAPAGGLIPLWIDDRDPQKFWTFWTTLLILFLTILSFLATLLQTYVALRTLNQQCSK